MWHSRVPGDMSSRAGSSLSANTGPASKRARTAVHTRPVDVLQLLTDLEQAATRVADIDVDELTQHAEALSRISTMLLMKDSQVRTMNGEDFSDDKQEGSS